MSFSLPPSHFFAHQKDLLTFPKLAQKNLKTGRCYVVEETGEHYGQAFPSITRILKQKPKPELEAWKLRVGLEAAERDRDWAAIKGHELHGLSECYLNNQPLPKYLPAVGQLWQFLRPWLRDNVKTVLAQEQDVVSFTFGVAGRLDLLAELSDDGTIAVIDIKNSKRPKKPEWIRDYFVQGTFYALAVYELTKKVVKRIVFPVVSPQGLQIFETKPANHFRELESRINTFYETYSQETVKEIELDTTQAPVV